MNPILLAVLLVAGLGLIAGLVLAVASVLMAVPRDEKAEALEFRASESFRGLGQKLSDLELKPNILLSCINRRGKIIIPSGNDAIEKGDTVIVVTTADRFINDLNDILDEEKGLL